MTDHDSVRVKTMAYKVPVAEGQCEHDWPVLYNLAVGIVVHTADGSNCAGRWGAITSRADVYARGHMRNSPGHEVVIGTDEAWHCVTCEAEESAP